MYTDISKRRSVISAVHWSDKDRQYDRQNNAPKYYDSEY